MKNTWKRLLCGILATGALFLATACSGGGKDTVSSDESDSTEGHVTTITTTERVEETTESIPEVMKDPVKAEKINELLNTKHVLRADENGQFKVLILSDVQFSTASISRETRDNIEAIVSREQPDLVIFNGDNSFAINHEKTMKNYVTNMTRYLEENKIPWAHVYGNHDAELWRPALDKETQQAVYESFEYCVSKAGDEDLFGVGNFVLPVLEHDSDKIAFNIWCFDSGTGDIYTDAHAATDVTVGNNTFWSHYENMEMNQVEWFKESAALLEEYNGAPIPGMMAFHIPLQETYYAWASRETDNLEWTGEQRENISAHAQDVPLFDAAKENKILAIVNSHDHINDFMVKYQGIRLCYTACIGTYEYHADDMLGGRVVEFNVANPDDVNTYMSYVNERIEGTRDHENVPTPEAGSEGHISNFITDKNLTTYLTFDGDVSDKCGADIQSNGTLDFTEGYFGQCVGLENGYVSIPSYAPGTDSFSVALWVNTRGVSSDPALFANKDWNKGVNQGYILSINRSGQLKFNLGNGSARTDLEVDLPGDYRNGWMHVTLVVDRTAGTVMIAVDFGEFNTLTLPSYLQDISFDSFDHLTIGQDATGTYDASLTASLDEFMIFDGALTEAELAQLAAYYGK
ncbi:MAG: hypothetical protein E7610_10300 [Ruminococcaceae bacterium]|nr:hypothetical protein [Oscillospiraceae bacterium]